MRTLPSALLRNAGIGLHHRKGYRAEDTDYHRTVAAGKAAQGVIQAHVDNKKLTLGKKELTWLNGCTKSSQLKPKDENVLTEEITGTLGHLFDPRSATVCRFMQARRSSLISVDVDECCLRPGRRRRFPSSRPILSICCLE